MIGAPLARQIVVALALAMPGGAAAATYTEPYLGASGPLGVGGICDDALGPNSTGTNVGAVCFSSVEGEQVTVSVEDETGLPVAAWARFTTASGDWIRQGLLLCGESGQLPVPDRWSRLEVFVSETFDTVGACAAQGRVVATATRGVVRAEFAEEPAVPYAAAAPESAPDQEEPAPPAPPEGDSSSPVADEPDESHQRSSAAPPDETPPSAKVRLVPDQTLPRVFRHGLALRLTSSENATARITVAVRRHGVVKALGRLAPGENTIRVRFGRAATTRLRGVRRLNLAVMVELEDAHGNVGITRCRGKLKRA